MYTRQPAEQLAVDHVRHVMIHVKHDWLTTRMVLNFTREFPEHQILDALHQLRDEGFIAVANGKWYRRNVR